MKKEQEDEKELPPSSKTTLSCSVLAPTPPLAVPPTRPRSP
ncbi:hypothetical protein [Bartonella sp. CL25QHWL]